MNIILLFRILLKNRYLILMGGVLMFFTIYFLTRNQANEYSSSTVIYTGIATGFNIESGANSRYDFFGTNAKFDNLINLIKSRETQEDAIFNLLAVHLIADSTGQDRFQHLHELFSDSVRRILTDVTSLQATVGNIRNMMRSGEDNEVYRLLFSENDFYSLKKISSITVKRIQNSDLIQLDYSCSHPRITQQTLEELTKVFLSKYISLQSGQTNTVVDYFEKRLESSSDRLAKAEEKLLAFKKKYQIINYYEQTKFIADQKEKLDKDYQEQIMALSSARAALAELEGRISIKTSISLQSDKILDKRKRLSDLSSKIAMAQVYNKGNKNQIAKWNEEAESLKISLRQDVEKLDTYGKTTTGIPLKEILKDWLEKAVEVEQAQAIADVIKTQKEDFFIKYKTFAPIGSELSKIEREIEIAEQEYMNNLKSLNQSKLKQQNIELSSTIRVLDPPYFPLEPKKSMKKILWVLGFIIGSVLVAASIILLEFLDSTIKTPKRAEEFSKLPLIGVFPKIDKKVKDEVDHVYVSHRLIEIIVQRMKLILIKDNGKNEGPVLINIASNRPKEGKGYLTSLLVDKLRQAGHRVLVLKPYHEEKKGGIFMVKIPYLIRKGRKLFDDFAHKVFFPGIRRNIVLDEDEGGTIKCLDEYLYEINNDFFEVDTVAKLVQFEHVNVSDYDFVFLILPPMLQKEFPASLVMNARMSLFITRSNRVWGAADTETLNLLQNTVEHKPRLILNGTRMDYLDSMIGEIPKKRSWKRQVAKRIVTLDFWSDDSI